MMKKSSLLIFSFLPIVLGIFLVSNSNFLEIYGTIENAKISWIDDCLFGFVLIIIGILLLISVALKNIRLQCFGFISLGSSLFAISSVYFYRYMIGYPNLTWILSIALFILIYTSINKAGEDAQ